MVDKTSSDPMIGRVLDGRYRIGARIARGGMATVYEAMDLRLDRVCAVKVMHAGMGDDEQFAKRFVREAQSAARLSHPNVVAVFDQGDDRTDGDTLYLVMEFVPGETLRDVVRNEAPVKPLRAVELLEPVLAALGAAHDIGMIHRDIKPENVLLTPEGRIKVADFGLARAVNAETQHTATGGVLIGTVSYLAPELVERGSGDARADVYAVGVLLYELLTGQKPHAGDTPIQVAYKHVHEDVPAPSLVVGGIPPYVDALVARATARDLDQRPADAKVLLRLFRQVHLALDAGVSDDPELTADLAPRQGLLTQGAPEDDVEATTVVGLAGSHAVAESTTVIRGGGATVTQGRRAATVPGQPTPPATGRARPAGGSRPPARRPGLLTRHADSRRGPILLASVLALALVAALAGWYLGVARYTTTPGVIGLSQEQAAVKLKTAGLALKAGGSAYSETITKGSVIRTSPKAGDRVRKSGTVKVVLSLGQERHEVPDLSGKTVDQAQQILGDAHLQVGNETDAYNDDGVPEGQIFKTEPATGTPLPRDTQVAIFVSKGPTPFTLDDYTGKLLADVQAALQKAGITVAQTQDYSPTVPAGSVISQEKPKGTVLHKGDTLNLVVSQGLPPVKVPSVLGKSASDAQKALEALGFVVDVQHVNPYFGLNRAVRTDPGENSMLQPGKKITLYIT